MKTQTAELDALRAWWYGICDTNNAHFVPLLFDRHRYLVLKGGGGSGKSIFAGRKILERCTTEPGHLVLVVRKVANTLRDSCFTQLVSQAAEYYSGYVDKVIKSPMEISFINGSRIIFRGLDDVEKLKSIFNVTMVWIEEASEVTEADFNQLDIRLRTDFPYYKQMIITFNPVSVMHWLKKRFFDRDDPKARVHESTYLDNRFLIPEARETLEGFRETDEYYYMVYCLGQWGVTGKTVFPGRIVGERLAAVVPPKKAGYFTVEETADRIKTETMLFREDERGALVRIWKEPEAGVPYVIGADTAGDGSDWFAAHVVDNLTGEQVAVLHMQTGEKEFVNQLFCLGTYYNTALLAVEDNFSSYPNNELQRLRYPRLYVRQSLDSYTKKTVDKFGFRTEPHSRNTIIAKLINYVRKTAYLINDSDTLGEMLTFVRNEQFRPEAEEGAHDDLIMSLAITLEARGQQSSVREEHEIRNWNDHQRKMWARASREEREILMKEWGKDR